MLRTALAKHAESAMPLVTQREMDVFQRMCLVLESNPRRLKRVVQTYTLISEVAKRRPQAEDKPQEFVASLPVWKEFSSKLVKWTCLCELYPYRMSLLVLIVLDFEQKAAMNRLADRREVFEKKRSKGNAHTYYRYHSVVEDKEGQGTETPAPMTFVQENDFISTVYNDHVERFLYSHKLSESMLRTP